MDLIEKLVRELEIRNFSKKTIKSYVYFVGKFLDYVKKGELDEETVKNYIQIIMKKQNPSTVSSNISAIEFFFINVLGKQISVKHPKRNKTIPEVLTLEEVKRLINATTNIKHRLILKFFMDADFV